MRKLYSVCVSAAEMADSPMSAPPPAPQKAMTVIGSPLFFPFPLNPPPPTPPPPPSPQKAMTLIGSSFIFPLRINARSAAAVPKPADPLLPNCVCIQGTAHEGLEQVVFATHTQP